jgi:hypothetical protein
MAYDIDRKAIAAANPRVDLAKVEEALSLHAKLKELLSLLRRLAARRRRGGKAAPKRPVP